MANTKSVSRWTKHFPKGTEEIHQDNKSLLKLSGRKPIFIVPDSFLGKLYVHIREYYIKKPSDSKEVEFEPYLHPTTRAYLRLNFHTQTLDLGLELL